MAVRLIARRAVRPAVLALLAVIGALSVAVFVGALDWGTPAAVDPRGLGVVFRGVLYPVLGALLVALVVGLALELRRRRAPASNRRIELIWVTLPVVALLAVAAGERELRASFELPALDVIAGLEAWTGADLEITAGEPARLSLRSSDVSHTLVVPALDVELAVEPGPAVFAHLPASSAGQFEVSCSLHDREVGSLRVVPGP